MTHSFGMMRRGTGGVWLGQAVAALVLLGGCSSSWLPSSGPSQEEVVEQGQGNAPAIHVIEVNDLTARKLVAAEKRTLFSETMAKAKLPTFAVGPGDSIEVSAWEAPPPALFASMSLDPSSGVATSRMTTFPDQEVNSAGTISIPFAGAIKVTGLIPTQIETEIVRRLQEKANQPQILVRVTKNVTSSVTVVGEVGQSARMPLSAKGERLLDAIAAAGGVKQPVGKVSIQMTREGRVAQMPLDQVIQDPKQNVTLQSGDVITALHQPLSYTVLGAAGRNQEMDFEAKGITLAQALGRINGVQDLRADAKGMFIFRFEEPALVENGGKAVTLTPDNRVPVVYQVDLQDPRTFLVAQNFPIRNRDVIYVANAPAVELQKFLNILYSTMVTVNWSIATVDALR